MNPIRKLLLIKDQILNIYRIKKYSIILGNNVTLNGICYFNSTNAGCISIGKNTRINSGKKYNPIGGDSRTIIRSIDSGKILIGDNVGISNSAIVAKTSVTIKDDVMIGGSCKIYDTDFHSLDYDERMQKPDPGIKSAPVVICKGAFIGAHSIILKGVTIGEKSIVGAGSVVTKSIPAGEIWAGNPAKMIKKI